MLFFCIIAFLCAIFFGYQTVQRITHPLLYKSDILYVADICEIAPSLIASIINVESSFNTYAVSDKGAIGLMQLLPSTALWLAGKIGLEYYTESDLTNPQTNILLGTTYLRYLFDNFECEQTALCAYNAGEGVVRGWLENKSYSLDGISLYQIPYIETQKHLQKIVQNRLVYQKWL